MKKRAICKGSKFYSSINIKNNGVFDCKCVNFLIISLNWQFLDYAGWTLAFKLDLHWYISFIIWGTAPWTHPHHPIQAFKSDLQISKVLLSSLVPWFCLKFVLCHSTQISDLQDQSKYKAHQVGYWGCYCTDWNFLALWVCRWMEEFLWYNYQTARGVSNSKYRKIFQGTSQDWNW